MSNESMPDSSTDPRLSVQLVKLGRLHVPSGHIYCCDPFLSHEVNVLEETVPAGEFDVDVCVATLPEWGSRVALARVRLSTAKPVEWRQATFVVEGERQAEFRVDAGLACFMDQQTRDLFVRVVNEFHAADAAANYYDDILAAEFKQNADPSNPYHAGDWALHTVIDGDPRNVAMFASGLGDGWYSAYWGVDDTGKPAMLVADFGILPTEAYVQVLLDD
jgi:Protein of unknown function (DUF4241)